MQFVLDNGVYKVARITGPSHNFLGIRLSDDKRKMKVLSLQSDCCKILRINEEEVVNQVSLGLARINENLSKQYFISEVQFVASDTYSSDVYELLTMELISRIDGGGYFEIV